MIPNHFRRSIRGWWILLMLVMVLANLALTIWRLYGQRN